MRSPLNKEPLVLAAGVGTALLGAVLWRVDDGTVGTRWSGVAALAGGILLAALALRGLILRR
jgi:hypothetical protein